MQAAGGKTGKLAGSSIPGTCMVACSGKRSGLLSLEVLMLYEIFRAKKTPTS